MQPLSFVFADRATVPGWLGTDVQKEVLEQILEVKPDRVLLITDETVDALHGSYFAPIATESAGVPPLSKFVLPCGDACKSWSNLTALMEWAFGVGATKRSLVVAFGGGALLNVTGLFASMFYRGSKLIYVPTTLLAMHDVVTSLKTSICFDGRKNNIGTFYAPLKILIDASFCRTLPRGELLSGVGELAKNAALFGRHHAEAFCEALSGEDRPGEDSLADEKVLAKLLALGIEAKMTVLLEDAYEKTSGMIFEYGHTVSHAIEKAYGDGVVPHGLGVTFGMLSSTFAAERLGVMSKADREEHDKLCWLLLRRWPLPEPKPSAQEVLALAMRDSKRGIAGESDDEISDVLLRKMGSVVPTSTSNLSKFPAALVEEWLLEMGFPQRERLSSKL